MTTSHGRVIIADDQVNILDALRLLLGGEGYDVATAASPAEMIAELERSDFDVALVDLNYTRDTTSGHEGFELLDKIKAIDPTLPVLVMTGWSSVSGAVEAMRRGARDYIEKPWDDEKLLAAVQTQLELRRALRRSRRLQEENTRLQRRDLPTFIAEAPAMKAVRETIERVAPSDAAVLITGEHGTGKEVVASLLHRLSTRSSKPLVTMNAGGLSEGVAESELFGHVKGAFTDARTDRIGCFELADEGTLFLDEIANMPLAQQARLLRVLQTGEFHPVGSSRARRVDVRVLAATNADVAREAASGRLREDLLYRLNTVELRLPALRDRRDDIPDLASTFLARPRGDAHRTLSSAAMQALLAHSWPGNVRELEHVIERASLLAAGDEITTEDLMLRPRGEAAPRLEEMTIEQVERYLIERALAAQGGNVSEAARVLGLSRSALYRRLASLGIRS
jgi:DNA-binding NtrC family response regulator